MNDLKGKGTDAQEIKKIFFRFLQKWYYFAITLPLAAIVAYGYLWYVVPQYKITGKVLVEDKKISPMGDNAVFGQLDIFKSNKVIENEIEVINSRSLISKAMKDQEFDVIYKRLENLKFVEVYNKSPFYAVVDSFADSAYYVTYLVEIIDENLFILKRECDDFDLIDAEIKEAQYKFGDVISTRFGNFTVAKRPQSDFTEFSKSNPAAFRKYSINFRKHSNNITNYKEGLQIAVASKSSTVLILSIMAAVPEKGEDFINRLMDVYIQNGVDEKNKVASNTLEFIKGRLELITLDLAGIETGIEKYKSDKGITDIGEEGKIFLQSVKEYDTKLSEINMQLSFIEYLEAYLKDENNVNEISPSVAGIQDLVLVNLLTELSKLQGEKERLILTTKEDNPIFKIINKQIKTVKLSIADNIHNLKNNLTISQQTLKKVVASFEGQIKQIPKTERELVDIQRQQIIKEKLYLFLLQKQEETSIALASTVSDNRIIDRAYSSAKPVEPVKRNVVLIALALGLIIPALFITVLDYFNDKVNTREQIETITSAPIIGLVGESDSNTVVAINEKIRTSVSEEFRAIRTNLQYMAAGDEQRVILVTSSMSGEGKTFISINLGMTLAISGKKTIVLEMDLRKPKLSSNLELNNDIGISNYLVGACSVDEIIKNSGLNSNFDVIGSGPIPPNPSELLLSDKLDRLIDNLKIKYDYILIDSPPVGLVSDSLVISRTADISVYIVRQGYTRELNLYTIKDIYQSKQLNKLSIIFNGINRNLDSYGYGYGYGYGYYEESPTKKNYFINKIFGRKS